MEVAAVYIHIPFCHSICSYCDFCKMYYHEELVDDYLTALEKEIATYYHGEEIKTLYIGGGSPSCLSLSQLKRLFQILDVFHLKEEREVTIEVNPEDIEEEKLRLWKRWGVNRISIGHETAQAKYLADLGRSSCLTSEALSLVKRYFSNINVDLMYGFASQTKREFLKDIFTLLSFDVPHISTYSLILEEHTKLYLKHYPRLDEDVDASFYYLLSSILEQHGYTHYEISNFAKEGYASNHNLTYWQNDHYYGFGLGASGYLTTRYTNTRSLSSYCAGKYRLEEERVTKEDAMVYEMILGLRTAKGVSKSSFFRKFGCQIEQSFDIMELLNQNLLELKGDYYSIPKEKWYLENSILIKFLEVKHEK